MSTPARQDDVVRLAAAANSFQAHIWEQALEDEGIHCKVVGDYLDAVLGEIPPGLTAEVWVHRNDLVRAQEILRQGERAAASTTTEEDEPE